MNCLWLRMVCNQPFQGLSLCFGKVTKNVNMLLSPSQEITSYFSLVLHFVYKAISINVVG